MHAGRFKQIVERVIDWVVSGFNVLAMVSLFLMMLLITTNTLMRYLFSSPITGMYEFVEMYLMMMVFYFSIAHVERIGGNIQVDLVSRRFQVRTQNIIAICYLIAAFLTISFITYLVTKRGLSFWERGSATTGVIQFPIYIEWAIVSIGLALLLVLIFVKIIELLHLTFSNEPADDYITNIR